ncbi:MAG: plsY [Dehalococcoidia bacterium]|nr:plsY [Dehalococcoidia bacterium]
MVEYGLAALAGYLIGSIPSGLLIGKAVAGIDLRRHGSGNPGAANALRILGPRASSW